MSEVNTKLLLANMPSGISVGQKARPEYIDDLRTLYEPLPEELPKPPLPKPGRPPAPVSGVVLPPESTLVDDARQELDRALVLLSADQLKYVEARSRLSSDAAVAREWGIRGIYQWKRSREPEVLDQVINWLQLEKNAAAEEVLGRHLMKAAVVKTDGLDSVDERLRQSAATEILDRALGKPVQRVDKKTQSETLIVTVDF